MPAVHMNLGSVRVQDLRDQKPQFAVAEHRHTLTFGSLDLIENLARGGDGFNEHRMLGRDRAGYLAKIAQWERQIFGERSRVFDDAEYTALRTMAAEASRAPVAIPAGQVDLSSNPLAHPFAIIGFHYFADKFVSRCTGESVV